MPFAAIPSDIVACTLAVLATGLLAIVPGSRGAAAALVHHSLRLAKAVSALLAWGYDLVLPVSERNAAVSRVALLLWSVLNMSPVALWIVAEQRGGAWQLEAAMVAALLASMNTLFLAGAYWAVREGIEFMNGDIRLQDRRFGDLSTATNTPVLLTVFVIDLAQVAVVQQWLQEYHGTTFIVTYDSLGVRYFDHVIAVVGALPGIGFYLVVPGLAERIAVAPGLGSIWVKCVGTFGSLLIFGALFGLMQRHWVLRRMIERLLLQPENAPMESLLRERLLRAPSVVKRELRDAFIAEPNDGRKLRLLALALRKASFTAPIYFLRGFRQLSPVVRDKGAGMVAAFVERHIDRIYPETQREILEACCAGFRARAFKGKADLRRVAAIALPCMEHLFEAASADSSVLALLKQAPLQTMLGALLREPAENNRPARAASLLKRIQEGRNSTGPAGDSSAVVSVAA